MVQQMAGMKYGGTVAALGSRGSAAGTPGGSRRRFFDQAGTSAGETGVAAARYNLRVCAEAEAGRFRGC